MSGICGIINFDGKPVDPEMLGNMAKCISYRGLDGINYWIEDNAGLVHLALNTTPESLFESQPLLNKEENLIMVADARVDNRDELITSLKSQGYLKGSKYTDADLIMAAYECWGEKSPKHIIGDFAFAIWDSENEKLFIARDVIGMRQLFYAKHENSLYFASAVQPIAHALPKLPSLNIQLMKDFLRRIYNLWACQTIYDGILRLPPAHSLSITDSSMARNLYYIFGQEKYHYSSDEEWKEAFLELFDEILLNQMRSITPVGIWVSGGLDSSSLACQAYDLRQENSDIPEIKFISDVFEDTPSQDEKIYFDAVAERCKGTAVRLVKSDDYWSFGELGKDDGFPLDEPDVWELRGLTMATIKATVDEGCRVYLTGQGSDDIFGLYFYNLPSSLRDVQISDWLGESVFFKQKNQINWMELIYQAYLLPAIPEKLRYWVWMNLIKKNRNLPWLNGSFHYSNTNECEIEKEFMKPPGLDNYGLNAYQMIRSPWYTAHFDMFGVMTAYSGIELRHPYLDRRMIEFTLSTPHHLRSYGGINRVLLRESMKGKLPELVRTRTDKSSALELNIRGVYEEKSRIKYLIQDSQLEKLGFVDSKNILEEFNLFWKGKHENYRYLCWFITLETWLREQNINTVSK